MRNQPMKVRIECLNFRGFLCMNERNAFMPLEKLVSCQDNALNLSKYLEVSQPGGRPPIFYDAK